MGIKEGTSSLVLHDENGKARIRIKANKGVSALRILDEKDRERVTLGQATNEQPGLLLRDEKGKYLWRAP